LGLFAFAYAMLHVSVYAFLDQTLDVQAIVEDVINASAVS
jgi:DMSO/TMAO reductase YedYZ heme-binding membrane subunit